MTASRKLALAGAVYALLATTTSVYGTGAFTHLRHAGPAALPSSPSPAGRCYIYIGAWLITAVGGLQTCVSEEATPWGS